MKIIKVKDCWDCPYMGRSSDNALYWCRLCDHDAPTVKELFAECDLPDLPDVAELVEALKLARSLMLPHGHGAHTDWSGYDKAKKAIDKVLAKAEGDATWNKH